jgi:hypothetical protein
MTGAPMESSTVGQVTLYPGDVVQWTRRGMSTPGAMPAY